MRNVAIDRPRALMKWLSTSRSPGEMFIKSTSSVTWYYRVRIPTRNSLNSDSLFLSGVDRLVTVLPATRLIEVCHSNGYAMTRQQYQGNPSRNIIHTPGPHMVSLNLCIVGRRASTAFYIVLKWMFNGMPKSSSKFNFKKSLVVALSGFSTQHHLKGENHWRFFPACLALSRRYHLETDLVGARRKRMSHEQTVFPVPNRRLARKRQ
ncbi:hypothetical protein ARMSODRAFT_980424 [Armillaria solidipes]|uniref:Uncharacterized protein n=1 Tax=Armillaria solidipes TaxID=1076256 RepID=A0A2H3B6Y4_9AGAR|nr:hypothetical protein ARMSODRAFT_980424 [Armillaria solidipes]